MKQVVDFDEEEGVISGIVMEDEDDDEREDTANVWIKQFNVVVINMIHAKYSQSKNNHRGVKLQAQWNTIPDK